MRSGEGGRAWAGVGLAKRQCNRKFTRCIPLFDNNGIMKTLNAAELLAALGHESRLSVFRLLVEAGPDGVVASMIGEKLGLPAPTLSFHLAHLSRVGLIRGQKESRFIRYCAEYATMDELIAFLTSNCCQGKACLPKTAACDTTAKRRTLAEDTSSTKEPS